MRTVHFIGGPLDGQTRAAESTTRAFPVMVMVPRTTSKLYDYQIHALVHGAHVHHVATLPGSPDPIAQLLAAYFKE